MKNSIFAFLPFLFIFPAKAEMITVNVNRVCYANVNVPYTSDNLTDEEWHQFKECQDYLYRFNNIK